MGEYRKRKLEKETITITAGALSRILAKCWARETSYEPSRWSADNPAWGQCAVTALIVQDFLGGKLVAGEVGGIEHYWNVLPKHREIDLTKHQFSEIRLSKPPAETSRKFILSFPSTRQRYRRLRSLVLSEMKRISERTVKARSRAA